MIARSVLAQGLDAVRTFCFDYFQMANDKLQASNLRQALRFADWSQADLVRAMRENREGLACSESYMSKIANGLKPGPQYRAAINRALATRNVEIKWD